MKIRTDFVSNSSSSSFVVMGQKFTIEELKKSILEHHTEEELLELVKKNCKWADIEEADDLFSEAGNIVDVVEALNKNLTAIIEGDGIEADDYFTALVGIDIENASDSKTILDLKKDCIDEMTKAKIDSDISKVKITPAGTDASGFTFIEDRG